VLPTEVKRLLAAVKNSVGHEDIEGSVQKVMDIMVDNQLKHAEDTLHELEAIRGSKVDARGVEVQGDLDPAGAHTMKVFEKTRGWEKTDIEEAIAEAQQRMGSSDAAVADEASLDYTGLQLALEYAENIKDSKVEERKLREEIKQAHDDTSERWARCRAVFVRASPTHRTSRKPKSSASARYSTMPTATWRADRATNIRCLQILARR